ncbi:transcriptional regulator, MerR family [Polaromonas sp. OV174]|uniref:MerR family transcriptional regulator n=1 Tax=Polaromonas sp. OV174 TaxID=1855300 RepID=UPI0008F08A58|nr:MerR family transcriptional regulator [Polaromonas sp. OV174]SFC32444.1 transcriptional regulator, MerR family [Polaromonas sp. OV174]
MEKPLPSIPAKRYFTIGEVSDLCGVKPHVLRYWEQEFTQLRPMKRRGNRRYYQHHEVLMIRRIRDLLYDQGFTISGARNKLQEIVQTERDQRRNGEVMLEAVDLLDGSDSLSDDFDDMADFEDGKPEGADLSMTNLAQYQLQLVRRELFEIRDLLSPMY